MKKIYVSLLSVLLLSYSHQAFSQFSCGTAGTGGAVIQQALIHAINNPTGTEGRNEFIVFKTTDTAYASSYTINYGSGSAPGSVTASLAGTNITSPAPGAGSFTTTASGSTIVNVTSPSTIIPANSVVVFVPSDLIDNYNLTSLGSNLGDIYVVYVSRGSWGAGGQLANSGGDRYIQLVEGGSCPASTYVSYNAGTSTSDHGDVVSWGGACGGGSATTHHGTNGNSNDHSDAPGWTFPAVSLNGTLSLTSSPATTTQTICSGTALTSITYKISGDATGASFNITPAGSGITGSYNPGTQTYTISGTGGIASSYNYTITTTGSPCTNNPTLQGTVTVTDLPTANISATDPSVCSGSGTTISFNGTPNAIITYTVNGTSQTINLNSSGTASVATGNLTTDATYALVSAAIGTCSQPLSSSVTVTVSAAPVVSFSATDNTVCSGNGTSIHFSGTPNVTVTYTRNGTTQNITLDGTGAATVSTGNLTADVTYTLVSVDNGSCAQPLSSSITVTVSAAPVASFSTANNTVCSGNGTTINFNGTPNATVSYTINGTAQNITLDGTGAASLSTGNLTTDATYTLVSVDNGSCAQSLSSSITVTVNSQPTASINATNNEVCSGNGTTIYFSGTPNATVTYTRNGTTQNITLDGTGAANLSTGNLTTDVTYTLVSVDNGSCTQSLSDSKTITVHSATVDPITGDADVCTGATITLSDAIPGGTWSSDNGNATVDASGMVTGVTAGTETIHYTLSDACATTPATYVVNVHPPLSLTLSASVPNPISSGTTVSLLTGAGASYTVTGWEPASLFASQTATSQSLIVDSNTHVTVTAVSDPGGCPATASLYLQMNFDFFVPSVFTPNNDGQNDVFRAYGSTISEALLDVFNQWGELIYEGDALAGWNGSRSGTPQPVGVYVYVVRATMTDGQTIQAKGSFNLIR